MLLVALVQQPTASMPSPFQTQPKRLLATHLASQPATPKAIPFQRQLPPLVPFQPLAMSPAQLQASTLAWLAPSPQQRCHDLTWRSQYNGYRSSDYRADHGETEEPSVTAASPAVAVPVVPNFSQGVVSSHTESKTIVKESIVSESYCTGFEYTVSGTGVQPATVL